MKLLADVFDRIRNRMKTFSYSDFQIIISSDPARGKAVATP